MRCGDCAEASHRNTESCLRSAKIVDARAPYGNVPRIAGSSLANERCGSRTAAAAAADKEKGSNMGTIEPMAGQDAIASDASLRDARFRNGFDPKCNVVVWKDPLEVEGKPCKAIVFRTGADIVDRFVVAHGYSPETGEWSYGSYHRTFASAWEDADDSILGLFLVGDGDVSSSLQNQGYRASAKNIDTVLAGARKGDETLTERIQNAINAAIDKAVRDYGEFGDLEQ